MLGLRQRRLLRALRDVDDTKRWAAAKALSDSRDEHTVRRVERLLQSDADEGPRAAAAYVLGFSGNTDVAPRLASVLADPDESVVVRAYAAEALGHLLQHETVVAEVRTAIRGGLRAPEAEVRFWSTFAAGVLGLQETRAYLERLLATDHEEIDGWWSVGEEADWALRLLDGEEDPPLPGPVPVARADGEGVDAGG
jgi:HEAT repeat protein